VVTAAPDVGVAVNEDLLIPDPPARRRIPDHIADAGLDHVTTGDHISFHGGAGFDGLVSATSVLAANDRLDVLVGVYLAGLRHPMVTARQLATISQLAPGRLVLGAGVGGEDRSKISNAGVDPAIRGRRLDETLQVLRRRAAGETVDHDGPFFSLRQARILPPPEPRVPLVIGGSGDAAIRRTAAYGDGWLGIFCSARRFAATVERVRAAAAKLGRPAPSWFGLSVRCGLGADGVRARERLARRLEALYDLPAERFQHVTEAGTPEQVAARLAPYVEAGAGHLTLVTVAGSVHDGINLAAEVRRLLKAEFAPPAEGSAAVPLGAGWQGRLPSTSLVVFSGRRTARLGRSYCNSAQIFLP
jgi:alkanesulfonate monooxygenase SsuD/methylene tetrahydromethanopterin reductase-like flavin-dependent oxidoreductase (luciferase family)